MRTEIIAELGGIAEGNFTTALRQIAAASYAGVDAVKLQWLSSPSRLVERRHAEGYAGAYQFLAYPLADLKALVGNAHSRGLKCGCSVYLPEDVAMVAPLVDFLKVSSFEARVSEMMGLLLAASALTQRPAYVSLGMADEDETGAALNVRALAQYGDACLRLLHCVSAYDQPIPVEQWNLGAIRHHLLDGFSDHTRAIEAGACAALAGARYLEVHMRLDDSRHAHPDYGVAWAPDKLAEYVARVREAERMLGDGVKRQQACEAAMAAYRVTA